MLVTLHIVDAQALRGRVQGTDTLVRFPSRFTLDRRVVRTGDVVAARIHLHPSGMVNATLERRLARYKSPMH